MSSVPSDKSLYVVILNWNNLADTTECIVSLIKQTYKNFQIVLVDNGSTDNSVIELRKHFQFIEIIENGVNLGFQGGMNIGIKYALTQGAEYILLLNNDTIADPNMLKTLLEDIPLEAGIVSPMMYYYSEPKKVWSSGGKINPILLEMIKNQKGDVFQASRVIERDFIPSCVWLVKKAVFEQIGLLDEAYFPIYYDDMDFCLRVRRGGYKLYIITNAKILHKVSISTGGEYSPRERFLMARNSGYFFRKNMRIWQAPLIIIYRMGSALLWTIRLLIKRNFLSLKEYWRGIKIGWFGILPN